jgi:hypothetical protein
MDWYHQRTTKTMACRGRDPSESKIVISNKRVAQMNIYNYLGCTRSNEGVEDVTNKLTKFLEVTGIISQVLKPLTSPEVNQNMNIQHIRCTYPNISQRNLDAKRARQIQNHSNRDETYERNCKVHVFWPQNKSQYSEGKHYHFQEKSVTTKINGYMFIECTDPDYCRLLWNTNWQETGNHEAY